ncbi:MAG: phosphatase PAP2 family protein [Candidatus Krumholzibacteriota bacterium]
MDMKKEKPAVELLFMAYNVMLAGIWVLRAAAEPLTPLMVVLHVGLAFLFMEMPRSGPGTGRSLKILKQAYPYLFWTLAWSEIGWLYGLTLPVVHDRAVMAADLAVFGFHLNRVLPALLDWQWLRNVMGFSYLSYYLLILGPPLVLAVRKRGRELEQHTLGLMVTYLTCFAVYLVMPVLGPRDLAHAAGGIAPGVGGLFGPVINAFFEAGDSLGTAFPSSHCAGSVAAGLLVHRHFSRTTGLVCLTWAGFIVVSTVYTNNHYAIDAVAGVAVALMAWKLTSLYGGRVVKKSAPSPQSISQKKLGLPAPCGPERKGGLS